MLRLGYVIFMTAVGLAAGYAAYWVVRLLFQMSSVPFFLKVVVSLALVGLFLMILGLIKDKVRQGKEV